VLGINGIPNFLKALNEIKFRNVLPVSINVVKTLFDTENFDWTKTADIFKKGNVHKCVHTPSKNPLMISMCRTDYYTNTRKGGITIARFITKNY